MLTPAHGAEQSTAGQAAWSKARSRFNSDLHPAGIIHGLPRPPTLHRTRRQEQQLPVSPHRFAPPAPPRVAQPCQQGPRRPLALAAGSSQGEKPGGQGRAFGDGRVSAGHQPTQGSAAFCWLKSCPVQEPGQLGPFAPAFDRGGMKIIAVGIRTQEQIDAEGRRKKKKRKKKDKHP